MSTVELNDPFTGEWTCFLETNYIYDGRTLIDDSMCDEIMCMKVNGKYYRRILADDKVNVKWFGAKGDGDINDNGTIPNTDNQAFLDAITSLSKVFPIHYMTPSDELLKKNPVFGGFTLYIPNGKYLLSDSLVLPHFTTLLGESKKGVVIHQIVNSEHLTPRANVTNITGMAPNGVDVLMSESIVIKNITFSQGGIILQGAHDSIIDDVTVTRLLGDTTDNYNNKTSTGLSIKLAVNLKISNFKVSGSSGTGIVYEDSAGSGPSTTVTFRNIWLSHCKTGMLINGLLTESHAIQTSWIQNSIFEYNETGVEIKGITQNLSFRDIHFEQNKYYALKASESASFSLENIWADGWTSTLQNNNDFLIQYNAGLTSNNIVHLKNLFIKSGILIQDDYEGRVYVDGFINDLKYYDQNIKIYKTFDDIGDINKRPFAPIAGYNFYNTSDSKPEFFDGGSWRDADGMNADIKRSGTTLERPSSNLDTGFRYFDSSLGMPIYWQGTKWVKSDGTNA